MANFAKMMVIGNLGKDAEVTTTPNGQTKAVFSIAATRRFTTNGEKREETSWFRVVVWGKLAESVGKYLVKGKEVLISGRPQNRQYEKDGQKLTIFELVAEELQLLGGPNGTGNGNGGAAKPAAKAVEEDFSFDDVPF